MKENIRHWKLVTIKKVQSSKKNPHISAKWLCKCDCGNEKIVNECNLYGRGVKSCGCWEYKNKKVLDHEFNNEYFQKRVTIDLNGCWIWKGSKHKQGYGNARYKNKLTLAHRLSWIVHVGEIPEGVKICHKCDVTCCCNPEHLFLGSQKDNVADAIQKGKYENRKQGKRRNKLNWDQVQEIKKLHGEGMSREDIKEKYDVGQTCIAKILTGKSWNKNWTEEI